MSWTIRTVVVLAAACLLRSVAEAEIIRTGSGAGAITARDQFRLDVGGGVVAGPHGSFGGVRREINWDGVPNASAAPNPLPADFFNTVSPRGVVFSTPGTGFQVSANAGVGPVDFGNIDPSYPGAFQAFSPERLFTSLGSNVVDVHFFLAGTTTPAQTSAFGAIFSDVDLANTTSVQAFDALNNPLGTYFVPASPGSEISSFLGVSFGAPLIGRLRIISGNAALGAGVIDQNGNFNDLVVMDDFLYSEPTQVPEPATLALLGLGAAGVLARARRERAVHRRRRSTLAARMSTAGETARSQA